MASIPLLSPFGHTDSDSSPSSSRKLAGFAAATFTAGLRSAVSQGNAPVEGVLKLLGGGFDACAGSGATTVGVMLVRTFAGCSHGIAFFAEGSSIRKLGVSFALDLFASLVYY